MRFFALVFVIVGLSSVAPASSSADTRVAETGGDGFRLVKLWGGAEGAVLQIEYYGWLAERCNAGSGSGHMNHLNFYVRLNGKMGVFQETDCRAYEHIGISKPYAIVAVYSTPDQARRGAVVNPRFFDGVDDAHPWDGSRAVRVSRVWRRRGSGFWPAQCDADHHDPADQGAADHGWVTPGGAERPRDRGPDSAEARGAVHPWPQSGTFSRA